MRGLRILRNEECVYILREKAHGIIGVKLIVKFGSVIM